jgi:hypothetical protein
MADTLDTTCPTCSAKLKVPVGLAGKAIKCKACGTAFKVPAPVKPLPANLAKPLAAKPVAARPADAPIPLAADAPAKTPDDDTDGDGGKAARAYGIVQDDSHIPRCPFCAKELDPPDTKVCLNCGFQLLERKRAQTRKVYETTTGDYILHWLPAVACIVAIGLLVAGMVICSLNMRSWLSDTILDSGEKNEVTGRVKFYVEPYCFNVWVFVFGITLSWKAAKFAFRRLVINWRPPEVVKKE